MSSRWAAIQVTDNGNRSLQSLPSVIVVTLRQESMWTGPTRSRVLCGRTHGVGVSGSTVFARPDASTGTPWYRGNYSALDCAMAVYASLWPESRLKEYYRRLSRKGLGTVERYKQVNEFRPVQLSELRGGTELPDDEAQRLFELRLRAPAQRRVRRIGSSERTLRPVDDSCSLPGAGPHIRLRHLFFLARCIRCL